MVQRIPKILFSLLILDFILVLSCHSEHSEKEDLHHSDLDSGSHHNRSNIADASDDTSVPPAVESDPACQLNGKWISIQRTLNIALYESIKQATHNWTYWEFEQSGTEVTVKKGLKCGILLIERSDPVYAQVVADPPVWDAVTEHISNTGRKGEYGLDESGECFLSFEKSYLVRGATVSHFTDPNVSLDDAVTEAKGTTPGWEDWDKDGNPGITFRLAGPVVFGELYVVQREWTEYLGPTEKDAEAFTLEVRWNNEQVVVSQSEDGIPSADSWPSTDPGENFVSFVRVDQLKNEDGSDLWSVSQNVDDPNLAICEKMREVKQELFDHPVILEDLEVNASR